MQARGRTRHIFDAVRVLTGAVSPIDRTSPPNGGWRLALLAALVALCGCGGSGSSGFDLTAAENRTIDRVLISDGCEVSDGLTICTSSAAPTMASPTVTAQSEETRTPTPTGTPAPTRSATPTGTPARGTPTATGAPSATFTATPIPSAPGVDINVTPGDAIPCEQQAPDGPCVFVLSFDARDVPPDAGYRVALRTRNPDSRWTILPASDSAAVVALPVAAAQYQFAVLVFLDAPSFVPDEVDRLAETGADFAFVTPVLGTAPSDAP